MKIIGTVTQQKPGKMSIFSYKIHHLNKNMHNIVGDSKPSFLSSESRIDLRCEKLLHEETIESQISEKTLSDLRQIYQKLPRKTMNRAQLREAFKIVKISITDENFETLFKKMDSARDGEVNWDELVGYLLLEFRLKGTPSVLKSQSIVQPLSEPPKLINSHHGTAICRVSFLPEVSRNEETFSRGRYLTASRDGTINYWSLDFAHQRRVYAKNPRLAVNSTTITDMVTMGDVQIVCVSSAERDLRFYDTAGNKFDLRIHIRNFPSPVVCLGYGEGKTAHNLSCLVGGDTSGSIVILMFQAVDRGPFSQRLDRNLTDISYESVRKGGLGKMKLRLYIGVHKNWVSQVNYYGSLRAFISCSRSSKCSLLFRGPKGTKMKYRFSVSSGISCFALHEERQLLFTGGPDCLLRIWNPFVSKKAVAVLRGHRTAILAIVILQNGRKVISLAKDRTINVWDVSSQLCIQTYNRLPHELSEHSKISVIYNPVSRKIIIASMMIATVVCEKTTDSDISHGEPHARRVTCVLYNTLYKLVATTSDDSTIIMWDPWRGHRVNTILNAHNRIKWGESVPVEITAAAFDYSLQLLITGGNDGTLKVWSITNGVCIRKLQVEDQCKITGIVWLKNRILCSGYNQRVIEFADTTTGVFRKIWRQQHVTDIVCMAVRMTEVLATGSQDGELVLWHLGTGQPYRTFQVTDTMAQNDEKKALKAPEFDNKVSISALLFFDARQSSPKVGTLVVALNTGSIQVWSRHLSGGCLASFLATHLDGDFCCCLNSDHSNAFLITGHSKGYIKVWLLKNYATGDEISDVNLPELKSEFPFLIDEDYILGRAKEAVRHQALPVLLSSFKGHTKAVNAIQFVDDAQLIISGSSDCTVRLWSLGGQYIATLGTFQVWKTILPDIPVSRYFKDYEIPPDIRKIASSSTLKVLQGGLFTREKTSQVEIEQVNRVTEDKMHMLYGCRVLPSLSTENLN